MIKKLYALTAIILMSSMSFTYAMDERETGEEEPYQGRTRVLNHYQEALAIAQSVDDRKLQARALIGLGAGLAPGGLNLPPQTEDMDLED